MISMLASPSLALAASRFRRQLRALIASLCGVLSPSMISAASPPNPTPRPAVQTVIDAFDRHSAVTLAEVHALQDEHDFVQTLIRHPEFSTKVNDIVVECANALYQDTIDRYVAGRDVSLVELRKVWRNTTQSPYDPWTAPVYERLFTSVRQINRTLPAQRRLRILAGDPPIDWAAVRVGSDVEKYMVQRDTFFASVVSDVLAKKRRALLIIGMGHVVKAQVGPVRGILQRVDGSAVSADGRSPRPLAAMKRRNVTGLLEDRYPGSTFVILPHTGFRSRGASASDETVTAERRISTWSTPSIALIKDTWLGALDAATVFPGIVGPDGQLRNPYTGRTVSELADAYLFVGTAASLRRSMPPPTAFSEQEYRRELDRRASILFGAPFDPARALQGEDRR